MLRWECKPSVLVRAADEGQIFHTRRNSMAKWMPSTWRFAIFKSLGHVAPVARTTALKSDLIWLASMSTPTFALGMKVFWRLLINRCVLQGHETRTTPSAAMRSTRRWTTDLSSFMLKRCIGRSNYGETRRYERPAHFGIPYMSRPPIRSFRSKTVT